MLQFKYMNEKVAKKIGEAYAFASVLSDTFSSNQGVMTELFGGYSEGMLDIVSSQQDELKSISEDAGMAEVVLPKAERTGIKIAKMADMYVGDEWDNPVEVLEWMSFFVGGAIVHWQLIAGSGEAMDHEALQELAQEGADYYSGLMDQLKEYSIGIGKARAQA